MSDTLHESHQWGERMFRDADGTRPIPVCLDCRVDGFENEPAAFKECPGKPPAKKVVRKDCTATLASMDTPGHTHRCIGGHTEGNHFCGECRRWFGLKGDIL